MFSFDPLKTTLILQNNKTNTAILSATMLRGKCTNTEFFVPRIFLYSEWMRIFTQCNYTFSRHCKVTLIKFLKPLKFLNSVYKRCSSIFIVDLNKYLPIWNLAIFGVKFELIWNNASLFYNSFLASEQAFSCCISAKIYLFEANNRNTWKRCEICSQ